MSSLTNLLVSKASNLVHKKAPASTRVSFSISQQANKPMLFSFDECDKLRLFTAFCNDLPSSTLPTHSCEVVEYLPRHGHKFFVDVKLPDDVDRIADLVPVVRSVVATHASGDSIESTRDVLVLENESGRIGRIVFPKFVVKPTDAAIIIYRIAAELAALDGPGVEEYRWPEILTKRAFLLEPRPSLSLPYSKTSHKCGACGNAPSERSSCIACGQTGFVAVAENVLRIVSKLRFPSAATLCSPECVAEVQAPLACDIVSCSLSTSAFSDGDDEAGGDEGGEGGGGGGASGGEPVELNYVVGTPHCPNADGKGKAARPTGGLWGNRKSKAGFVAATTNQTALVEKLVRKKSKLHVKSKLYKDSVFVKPGSKIIAYLKGMGSNTCVVKAKDHKDSYVFAELTPSGMRILCSSKEVVNGCECRLLCRKQKPFRLTGPTIRALFPGSREARASSSSSSSMTSSISDVADRQSVALASRIEGGTSSRRLNVFGLQKKIS